MAVIMPERVNGWLDLAEKMSTFSSCSRRKVGAVLVNPEGIPVRSGWNTEQLNEPGARCDQGDCPRGRKTLAEQPAYAPYDDCIAVHAEAWVLRWFDEFPALTVDSHLYRLYVTDKPCHDCQALIDRFGCVVVVPSPPQFPLEGP